MTGYRLFYLTNSGRVRAAKELLAEHDAEAERIAEEQRDGPMELWALDRLVKHYPSDEATPRR